MSEEKETKKEGAKEYLVVQVPTEHQIAIQTPEGNLISEAQLLVKIANDVDEIKKGTLG